MAYFVLFIGFSLFAFLIRRFRRGFYAVAENSVSLLDKLISNADDDVKISLIQKSTNKLLTAMLMLLGMFLLAAAAAGIPLLIYSYFSPADFEQMQFTSFYSILSISAGATIPFLIPTNKKKHSDYSELSQLLHHLALDNYHLAEKLFKRECKKISSMHLERKTKFVIISGLARAGTTSLMNDLAKQDAFVSLNYANMPFLLAPNIWRRFYNPKTKKLKERSHKDGVMIGLHSNEALEEYFFKVKANDSFIKSDHLVSYEITQEVYEDYLDYQSIIRLDNQRTYLAKNNNFILRYASVRKYNEDFLMVILYREPLHHAASLLEKHKSYQSLQREDPFVLEYMNWLGHHEFGLNQKPFLFENSIYIEEDKNTLDYWLKNWVNYYRYALSLKHPNTMFVAYNTYCDNPLAIIGSILNKVDISFDPPACKAFRNNRSIHETYSEEVYKEALDIYQQLLDHPLGL